MLVHEYEHVVVDKMTKDNMFSEQKSLSDEIIEQHQMCGAERKRHAVYTYLRTMHTFHLSELIN